MRKLCVFLLAIAPIFGQVPDVQWTKATPNSTWPGNNGWLTLPWDPFSQRTILYGVPSNSISIYSTDWSFYNSFSNQWQRVLGNGSLSDTCATDTVSLPGDRHPSGQMVIDTNLHRLWLGGGVVCSGPVLMDMYYMDLNTDPSLNQFHRVIPAHIPSMAYGAWAYMPPIEAIYYFGTDIGAQSHDNWIYCITTGTSHPGALSVNQIMAGCSQNGPDDWSEIHPATQPGGVAEPYLTWDGTVGDGHVLMYGGGTGGGTPKNEIWWFDPFAVAWAQHALGSSVVPPVAPPPFSYYPPNAVFVTRTQTLLFHQSWGTPTDFEYSSLIDGWRLLTSTGTGATSSQVMAYDQLNNLLVGYSRGDNGTDIWQGVLPSALQPPPAITSISESPSVIISWVTDQASDSQVAYGLTNNYGSLTTINPSFITSHSVVITGLVPNATYHFQIRSKNSQGTLSVSEDRTLTTGN